MRTGTCRDAGHHTGRDSLRELERISRRAFIRRTGRGALVLGAAGTVGLSAFEAACSDSKKAGPTVAAGTDTPVPTPTPVPPLYGDLRSRPDLNDAPTLKVLQNNGKAAPGYIFLTTLPPAPPGPAIFDSQGRLVWFQPVATEQALNFAVVPYQGADALAWFEGTVDGDTGIGAGSFVLADAQYQVMKRVQGGGGAPLDLHEFSVTPDGNSVLVALYAGRTMDMTARGGLSDQVVSDSVLQEIDLASGDVLFEWHSLDHIGVDESVLFPPKDPGKGYDPFHLNSAEVDSDGNLLISARNTCSLYKLNRQTGEVMWRLNGAATEPLPDPKMSLLPDSERFFFQHDARRNADGTISIFDNGGAPYNHNGRAVVMQLDESALTANVLRQFGSDLGMHINYQGSAQLQPNGNMLVGWGNIGRVTEFTPDGAVCLDATFTGNSYRTLKYAWKAAPADTPAIAVARDGAGARVWASWNGATEVRQWRVLGGADAGSLEQLAVNPWDDFETSIGVPQTPALLAVEALDANGAPLGRSQPATLS